MEWLVKVQNYSSIDLWSEGEILDISWYWREVTLTVTMARSRDHEQLCDHTLVPLHLCCLWHATLLGIFIQSFGRQSTCNHDTYQHLLLGAPMHYPAELQWRSSKILEERSTKHLLEVGNLYQSFTTLGLEPVSIIHYTRPGTCINRQLL